MNHHVRRSSDRYGNKRVSVVNTVRGKNIIGKVINGSGSVKAAVSEQLCGVEL
jgi:hypothetical protein